jgi:hypothetical protein
MLSLAVLDAKGFINKYDLSFETQEVILNIQCGNNLSCRGEKCRQ